MEPINNNNTIFDIPVELDLMVRSYFDDVTLAKTSAVSKRWNQLNSEQELWKILKEKKLGYSFEIKGIDDEKEQYKIIFKNWNKLSLLPPNLRKGKEKALIDAPVVIIDKRLSTLYKKMPTFNYDMDPKSFTIYEFNSERWLVLPIKIHILFPTIGYLGFKKDEETQSITENIYDMGSVSKS